MSALRGRSLTAELTPASRSFLAGIADAPPAAFLEETAKTIDEQAAAFLKAFIFDFQANGGFAEVLQLAEEFRPYLPHPGAPDCEVDAAHRFLESRGETTTVQELRDKMAAIDADKNNRMALLEYLLFKYGRTVEEFLEPAFAGAPVPPHLLAALDAATAAHRQHMAERAERDQLYETLESAAGSGGVKGMRAKAELAQARARNWTEDWNARQLQGAAASRRAGRAVQRADKETLAREALEAEEARLAEEQAAQEAEAAEKRNAGRQALRARAALWEGEG